MVEVSLTPVQAFEAFIDEIRFVMMVRGLKLDETLRPGSS